jgi:hypothetical protein
MQPPSLDMLRGAEPGATPAASHESHPRLRPDENLVRQPTRFYLIPTPIGPERRTCLKAPARSKSQTQPTARQAFVTLRHDHRQRALFAAQLKPRHATPTASSLPACKRTPSQTTHKTPSSSPASDHPEQTTEPLKKQTPNRQKHYCFLVSSLD